MTNKFSQISSIKPKKERRFTQWRGGKAFHCVVFNTSRRSESADRPVSQCQWKGQIICLTTHGFMGLLWPMLQRATKFHGHWAGSIYVILQTDTPEINKERILLMTNTCKSLIPFIWDVLVLPLPPGFEVGTKLKPEHEEMPGRHLLLSGLRLQSKVHSQVLKTEQVDWN